MLLIVTIAIKGNAVHFNCFFGFDELTAVGKVYTCRPIVTLTKSSTLETVTGVHEPGYSNENVEFLGVSNQNMTFLPKGIELLLKNLKALSWTTNLPSISAKDLQPFPKLEFLEMYGNNLPTIDGNLFSFTPLLKVVTLDSDQIQHFGVNFVTNLKDLEYFSLQKNVCVDAVATSRATVIELAAQLSVLCPPSNEKCKCKPKRSQQTTKIVKTFSCFKSSNLVSKP